MNALAIADLDRQGELGQDRAAIAVGHHLHHGGEAACPKVAEFACAPGLANRQHLIAQAMAFLEQQKMLAAETRLGHAVARAERMLRGQGQREHMIEQRQLFDFRGAERQGQDQEIERAGQQPRTSTNVWVSRTLSCRFGNASCRRGRTLGRR